MLATTLLVSCSPEQDEIFEDSAAERIEASIQKIEETLESSPNGWHFELFTGTGGTNVMVKFADGKVQASDYLVHGSDVVKESLYSVIQNGGPVLTFDTYNEVFHAYSDPVAPGESAGDDEGLGADFEFIVEACTSDLIILRGLKHQRICRMVRQPETDDWVTTLGTLATMNDALVAPMYAFYYNGELVEGTNYISNNQITTNRIVPVTEDQLTEDPDATDKLQSFTVALVPTLDGFRTEEPFSYKYGDEHPKIQNFKFNAATRQFVCTDEGVEMYIEKVYPPANIAFANTGSTWKFGLNYIASEAPFTNNMSQGFTDLFTQFHNTDCVPYGEKLYEGYMGANVYNSHFPEPDFIFVFRSLKPAGDSAYLMIWSCTVQPVEGTEDQVVFSDLTDVYGTTYYGTGKAVINHFVTEGPWTITYDDPENPTKYTLVSTVDSTLSITVTKK